MTGTAPDDTLVVDPAAADERVRRHLAAVLRQLDVRIATVGKLEAERDELRATVARLEQALGESSLEAERRGRELDDVRAEAVAARDELARLLATKTMRWASKPRAAYARAVGATRRQRAPGAGRHEDGGRR